MSQIKSQIALGVACLFMTSVCLSSPIHRDLYPTLNLWHMGVGTVFIDDEAAQEEGIDDQAQYLRFGWRHQDEFLIYSLGFSIYLYDDNQGDGDFDNDYYYDSSYAEGTGIFFEGGYGLTLFDNFSLELIGGYEFISGSEQRFRGCNNCNSSDINLDGGVYISPRLVTIHEHRVSTAFMYQRYLSGDLEHSLTLSFGWHF